MNTFRELTSSIKLESIIDSLAEHYQLVCKQEGLDSALTKENLLWLFGGTQDSIVSSPKSDGLSKVVLTTVPADDFNETEYVDVSVIPEHGSPSTIDTITLSELADAPVTVKESSMSKKDILKALLWELTFYGPETCEAAVRKE